MIIFCQSCQTHSSIDDRHVPAQTFTVRCAKCSRVMTVEPPNVTASNGAASNSAAAKPVTPEKRADDYVAPEKRGDSHVAATEEEDTASSSKKETNVRRFALSGAPETSEAGAGKTGAGDAANVDVLQMLAKLLQGEAKSHVAASIETPPEHEMRGALVCASPKRADRIAELLARRGYEVFIADDAASAVAMMREARVGTVILDKEFDPAAEGTTHVRRMINRMQLSERRRLFLVGLSDDVRTMDAHAAFVQSFNLVVNISELESLPDAMHRTKNAFRELYAEFNKATMQARM